MRIPDSNKINVLCSFTKFFIKLSLSFFFRGGNPTNMKLSELKPETDKAAVTDEGPGKGLIFIPREMASFTNKSPGSDIKGVPASLTSAKSLPSSSKLIK